MSSTDASALYSQQNSRNIDSSVPPPFSTRGPSIGVTKSQSQDIGNNGSAFRAEQADAFKKPPTNKHVSLADLVMGGEKTATAVDNSGNASVMGDSLPRRPESQSSQASTATIQPTRRSNRAGDKNEGSL